MSKLDWTDHVILMTVMFLAFVATSFAYEVLIIWCIVFYNQEVKTKRKI